MPTRKPKDVLVSIGILAAVGTAIVFGVVTSDWYEVCMCRWTADLPKLRQHACGPFDTDFRRISSAHPNEAAVQRSRLRLVQIDQLVSIICQRLNDCHMLQPSDLSGRDSFVTANSLLRDYSLAFSTPVPPSSLSPKELQSMDCYIHGYACASGDFVCKRARIALADAPDSPEILELSMVIPLLATPDQDWSTQIIDTMPAWLRRPFNLEVLEFVALRTGHPQAAYQFRANGSSDRQLGFTAYARTAAKKLIQGRYYDAAIICLRAAVERARHDGSEQDVEASTADLAATFAMAGRPQSALDSISTIVNRVETRSAATPFVLDKLRYMYLNGQYSEIPNEASRYLSDVKYASYHSQMMYLCWIAASRDEKPAQLPDYWQSQFLTQFPDDPLGAEMHFANAMRLLGEARNEEAIREMELLERRFPHAAVTKKSKTILQRLKDYNASN
jgi:hypothetical protein